MVHTASVHLLFVFIALSVFHADRPSVTDVRTQAVKQYAQLDMYGSVPDNWKSRVKVFEKQQAECSVCARLCQAVLYCFVLCCAVLHYPFF